MRACAEEHQLHLAFPLRFTALLLIGALLPALAAGAQELARDVPPGTTRSGDLVALGRSVEIAGELDGNLVVTNGAVRLSGRVKGDVILIASDAELAAGSRIEGDLLSVGGALRFPTAAGARGIVDGRLVTLDAMESAFLSELRTSPLQAFAVSPLLLSFRLLILTGWLSVGLLLLFARPRRLATAALAAGGRLPFLTALGLTAALTAILTSTLLLRFAPAKLAFVLVLALVAALGIAKLFGLVVVFLVLGRWLVRRARRGSPFFGDPAALSLGLVTLGLVSLVPAAGALVWWLASFAGIGLSLLTSFGARQPGLV